MEAHCVGNLVNIRFEPLSYLLLNGLPNLAHEAWKETHFQQDYNVPYSVDWEAYQRMEDKNNLRFVSLREDETLIGYASILIEPIAQSKGFLTACFRDIYVTRSKRGYAASLVRFIENQMNQIGVRRVKGAERVNSPVNSGEFFKALGYKPEEIIHSKDLGVSNAIH